MEKYYTVFYKTDNNSDWQAKRLYLPFDKCEKYCKEQNYVQYGIEDLDKMNADDLHLLADVVKFDNNYYLPDEEIPYPLYNPLELKKFQSSILWEEEYANNEQDFEEVYKGTEQLWTTLTTNFILPDKTIEAEIVAQIFLEDYPKFLEKLEKNNQAVYHNEEISSFKWLAWLKDNSIRLIHQDYTKKRC